jgi:hypothetical protein
MRDLVEAIRVRLAPAIITSLGVVLVTAGLLTYADPAVVDALPPATPSVEPSPTAGGTPAPTDAVSPDPSGSPSASATPAERATATRVVVPALRIDLPVIRPPGGADAYPLCDVAMYIKELGQPGEGRATYLYAHARTGMFLPILDASKISNGKRMIGMIVQVFTSDDRLYLYEIREVRRHQTTLADAIGAATEELWLQTSEGPRGTPGKTQVIALPLSAGPADPADAHPTPKPVACG